MFPNFVKDKDFINLIKKMLDRHLISRMCKLSQIKEHPWFADFNWDDLLSLTIKTPYKPFIPSDSAFQDINFTDYIQGKTSEYEVPKGEVIPDEEKAKFEEWFKKF